ncbi:MAG: hypothetical protein H6605_02800 [Flavobacteriales bacterium]|nr:hypothetical protein [Flavobacteriales bacterium]
MNSKLKRRGYLLICLWQSFFILFCFNGLPIEVHFCKGEIISVGIFRSANKCKNATMFIPTDNQEGTTFKKASCCRDQQFFNHIEEATNAGNFLVKTNPVSLFYLTPQTLCKCLEELETVNSTQGYSDPPPLIRDLNILHGNFLI